MIKNQTKNVYILLPHWFFGKKQYPGRRMPNDCLCNILGTIFILRKDIGLGVQKMAIFLTWGEGNQKSPKTPWGDIKN